MALWRDSASSRAAPGSSPSVSARACRIPQTGQFPTRRGDDRQGYAYVGTVDTVLRAMETQQQRQPVDWVFCYTYNAWCRIRS